MKIRIKRRRGFTLVELLVVITIIALLAGIATPAIMKSRADANRVVAVRNLQSIKISLDDFDRDYGNYPDQNTAKEVTDRTGSTVGPLTGNNSNDYLRQLVAAGLAKDERIFYCKSQFTKGNADGDLTGSKALAAGEVGFGYIMNSPTDGQSGTSNGRRPLMIGGLAAGGTTAPTGGGGGLKTGDLGGGGAAGGVRDVTGDYDVFNHKAPILLVDGSVSLGEVREDKKIVMPEAGNRGILQTGEETAWGTDISPVLLKPKSK